MVQTGATCTTLQAMSKIRTTISVDSEALDVYRHMAQVTGRSLSATLGDWLAETADAAGVVTQAMVKAKKSPTRAMRDLQRYAEGVETQLTELQGQMRQELKQEDTATLPLPLEAAGKRGGDPARGEAPRLPAAARRGSRR